MPRPIWLTLNQSESPHGDVILTVGQTEQTEDSYYFTLDPNVKPGDESPAKAAEVMGTLISQWISRLDASETVFLPVGFSDQSMTWLRASTTNSTTNLTLGWSEDEGWAVPPSCVGDRDPSGFEPMTDVPTVAVYTPRLLSLLRANRLDLIETPAT